MCPLACVNTARFPQEGTPNKSWCWGMAPCSVCQYPPPLGGADSTNTTEGSTPQHQSCTMESTAVFASTRPPMEGQIVQTPLGFHGATTKEIYIPQSDSVRRNLLRFSRKHVWWKPPKKILLKDPLHLTQRHVWWKHRSGSSEKTSGPSLTT